MRALALAVVFAAAGTAMADPVSDPAPRDPKHDPRPPEIDTHHAGGPRIATALPPGLTLPLDQELGVGRAEIGSPSRLGETLDQTPSYDASYDRGYFASTGHVLGQGQFDISARSALKFGGVASIAAGLGRSSELSIDGAKVATVGKSLGASFKVGVAHRATWAMSMTASAHQVWESNSGEPSRLYMLALHATTCAATNCNAQLTFGAGIGAKSAPYSDLNYAPELEGLLILGKGWCRPYVEVSMLDGEFGVVALRFGGRHVTFDAGVGLLIASPSGSVVRGDNTLYLVGLGVRP